MPFPFQAMGLGQFARGGMPAQQQGIWQGGQGFGIWQPNEAQMAEWRAAGAPAPPPYDPYQATDQGWVKNRADMPPMGQGQFGRGGMSPGGGAAGIMAPRRSPEDQRMLQDPAFRQQYRQWVMSQGPGAGDWATPTGYQQWLQQGGQFPPASPPDPADLVPGGPGQPGLAEWRQQQGQLPPMGQGQLPPMGPPDYGYRQGYGGKLPPSGMPPMGVMPGGMPLGQFGRGGGGWGGAFGGALRGMGGIGGMFGFGR